MSIMTRINQKRELLYHGAIVQIVDQEFIGFCGHNESYLNEFVLNSSMDTLL